MRKQPPTDIQIRKLVLKWVFGFHSFSFVYAEPKDRKRFSNEIIRKYYQKFIDAFDKRSSPDQYESYEEFHLQISWIMESYTLPKEEFQKVILAGFARKRVKTDNSYAIARADLLQDFLVDLSVYLHRPYFNFLTSYLVNYEEFEKEYYKIVNNKKVYIKDQEDFLIKYWKANPDMQAKHETICNILYILDEYFTIIYHQ